MKNGICEVCGSGKFVQRYNIDGSGLLLCRKHRGHMDRYGKILERTVRDKNEIYVKRGVAHIVLRNRNQEVVGEVLIDKKYVERVKNIKWCLDNCGYARTGSRKGSRLLHRVLFGKKGFEIDHMNMNRLDNREKNIRVCTRQENSFNKVKQSNNKTGVLGVWFDKTRGKFVAEIKAGRKIYLGRFNTLSEAKKVRALAEKKYFRKWKVNWSFCEDGGIENERNEKENN